MYKDYVCSAVCWDIMQSSSLACPDLPELESFSTYSAYIMS